MMMRAMAAVVMGAAGVALAQPPAVRLDATHISLCCAPSFRAESTAAAPWINNRWVWHYEPNGHALWFYVCSSTVIEMHGNERIKIQWYATDSIPQTPLGEAVFGMTADANLDGGVTIEDLFEFLDWYSDGDTRADVDDGTGTGRPDGGVGIEDQLYFARAFDAGGNAPPPAPPPGK